MGFSSDAIHAGQEPDPATGAIITPIYQTSTYVQDGLGQPHAGFEYGRTQNPTRMALERNVAAIEAGSAAFAFASGMAAIDTLLTRLESGDHVLVSDNTYGGTFRLFERVRRKFGLDFTYVDTSKPELVEPAIKPNTKYLFIETPTIGKLSSMYLYAWEKGLKTTYYLRSRPATRIRQATVSSEAAFVPAAAADAKGTSSSDTPEICEACQ